MRTRWLLGLGLVVSACGPAEEDAEVVSVQEAAIHELRIGREEPSGIAPGFDLDNFTSNTSDGRSCFQNDFVDAEGREGIDNQLAVLMPLIDLAGEGALDGLLQGAIDEGRALMLLRMEHRRDGRVDFKVLKGEDVPLLGTNGRLLPGQTLGLADKPIIGQFEGGTMDGNVFTAGPMDVLLPVVVFSILYELPVQGAYVQFTVDETGAMTSGRLGGRVNVDAVLDIAGRASDRTKGLEMLVGGGVRDAADLDRDENGQCQSLSMGVTFDSVPVFSF